MAAVIISIFDIRAERSAIEPASSRASICAPTADMWWRRHPSTLRADNIYGGQTADRIK
ncbi:hypothetical protein FRZ44_19390 [Hypericibacter terrae]|uniref:Uncharacterized protein n=1 Tax=Hypericibacter terrae TaxID=2602015 RepID=A0A5J6MGM1_9PROT|nr:hypothetical protein FRZ44_19390 [Hypericibacter terrae]